MADTAFPYDRDRTPRDQPRSLLRVQLSGFTAVMTLSVPEISCLTEELQYRCSVVQTICDRTHANRSSGVQMTHGFPARPVVVVLGGGYAGIQVARPLDDLADVVLVEPKDDFVHNVAALRALVDPGWLERIYLPYTGLLGRGRVIRDRAVKADADRVVLASGAGLLPYYLGLDTES